MKLRKVYCKYIPLKNYIACTLFPWIFIRMEHRRRYTAIIERHEIIHAHQQVESLLMFFLLIYMLEYAVKLLLCKFNFRKAYHSISFETEAYMMQNVEGYEYIRKPYSWLKYIFKIS